MPDVSLRQSVVNAASVMSQWSSRCLVGLGASGLLTSCQVTGGDAGGDSGEQERREACAAFADGEWEDAAVHAEQADQQDSDDHATLRVSMMYVAWVADSDAPPPYDPSEFEAPPYLPLFRSAVSECDLDRSFDWLLSMFEVDIEGQH